MLVRRDTFRYTSYIGVVAFLLYAGNSTYAKAPLAFQFPDTLTSGNPIITHIRSADPAAEVWNDGRVWIYASHDPEDAVDYSTMEDYRAYSSADLVNWTDHGTVLHARDVSWGNSANAWMFAPDAAYKEGTYYLYFPTMSNDWQWRVGVATSPGPEGPFTDIGRSIKGPDHIDPTCFMDDDGQAYLIWGGGGDGEGGGSGPWIARLKENMTELAESPRPIAYGAENFGEGGYMHKRDSIYYFSWTCNTCWPYQGYYGMADNPYGPFEYNGELKRIPPGAQDHHSIIEFHGQSYYFYHVGNFGADGNAYRRNICVDSLYYNPDGTMREVTGTGVAMDLVAREPGTWIPGRIEAEDYFRKQGHLVVSEGDTATRLTGIRDGDHVEYILNVPGSETYELEMQINTPFPGTEVHLYIDDQPADTVRLDTQEAAPRDSVFLHKGRHVLKLVFSNPDTTAELLELYQFSISSKTAYFSIQASASEGGKISPEGISYYSSGDSAEFKVFEEEHFFLEEVRIDGVAQPLASTFVFRDIANDHSIHAQFSPCSDIVFTPYYQVNNEQPVPGTEIVATEGDTLKCWLEMEQSVGLSWTGPLGFTSEQAEINFEGIGTGQSGNYIVKLVNSQGCTSEVIFKLEVNLAELDVFEAEDFFSQSGVQLQQSTDLGGGWILGAIENNDWSYYRVEIDTSGIYDLTARVATATEGGTIEVSNADSIVALVGVTGTFSGSWQDWYTTAPLEVPFDSGSHRLKFTFRGGTGYLFNFNWFDLEFNRLFETDTTTTSIHLPDAYEGPEIRGNRVEFALSAPAVVEMKVISSNGTIVSTLLPSERRPPGNYAVDWYRVLENSGNLAEGLYLLYFRCNENVHVKKVMVF
ncbi:MAG: family 43 glycosylhydrolase [Bacteroidales bacterium]|nr:family 43 glycosylhydrolase [Bacteroidales bacterium]MDT8430406.1 family 43 glycosylhydrolase [Bacteroidales bacterium]